jgi:DNA-binding NarL/FixJ family response regulator
MDCQLLAVSLANLPHPPHIVGTAVSAVKALAFLRDLGPAVVLVSPSLEEGPLAGFDLVQSMRDVAPAARAIMLLDRMEPRMVLHSFQVGAKGIFSRERSLDALAKCIDVVHQGQIWASTQELQIILEAMGKRARFDPAGATGEKLLTPRETEVAGLVADGFRNREISERMNLSVHTVKNYLYRVYEKLGISSRVELTARLLDRGAEPSSAPSPSASINPRRRLVS